MVSNHANREALILAMVGDEVNAIGPEFGWDGPSCGKGITVHLVLPSMVRSLKDQRVNHIIVSGPLERQLAATVERSSNTVLTKVTFFVSAHYAFASS